MSDYIDDDEREGPGLLITNLCNRACPYCCVKDWITNDASKAQHMSLAGLDKVIKWAKEFGKRSVQLLGGEPMLHPEILEFARRLLKNYVQIKAILTNGLGDTELYREIIEMTRTTWLVNVDNPETYTAKEWELLNKNLELLKWKGKSDWKERGLDFDPSSLQFSITFFKPQQDYSYIIDLAKKYHVVLIRYALSHPAHDKSNAHADFKQVVKIKPTLPNFLRDCAREGIRPYLEEFPPPCLFTNSELANVALSMPELQLGCMPNMDVMPDLTVEYCQSMRGILPAYSIEKMRYDEIYVAHLHNAEKYKSYPIPRCKDCPLFVNKRCQGYCLRYKADYLKNESLK